MNQSEVEKLGLTGPPRSSLATPTTDINPWPNVAVFGSIVGGAAVAISVYVMRIKVR
ncbi:MAG: hypothetical protein ACREBA_00670 [Nitrosotalea sp.]